jgi:hypothetical protein
LSQKVATVMRDWLPSVIQSIEPYVSSEDIDKGARWSSEISSELAASDFGILCITPNNTDAPWLNFEAGALSKSIETSRVVPFLFRLERAQLPQGPLVQFQSVLATKDDVRRLVFSLNASCGERSLEETRLEGVFEVWWPKLEDALASITDEAPSKAGEVQRSEQDVMGEILELIRGQQHVLNNPEALLPPAYLNELLGRQASGNRSDEVNPAAVEDLRRYWNDLIAAVQHEGGATRLVRAMGDLEGPLRYLITEHGSSQRIRRSKLKSLVDLDIGDDGSVPPLDNAPETAR